MKALYIVLSIITICLLSSFTASEACEYAGSNIGYVKTQTQLALDADDLNKARFLTYKAIKAIYKSQKQLKDCGCEHAALNIEESQQHLKLATKATSINGTKILLMEAYKKTVASLNALEKHNLHERPDINKDLAMNIATLEIEEPTVPFLMLDTNTLHQSIDTSLMPYKESLQRVVDSVNCKDARAFANRVFKNCEQQLLKPDLSEGKKYYNLKTQEITADALRQLDGCGGSTNK